MSALNPENVDQVRGLLKEQLEAYVRFRTLFRKAFGRPRPLDHREEEFSRTKDLLQRNNRLLKGMLPGDLGSYLEPLNEQITFMTSLRSLQEYSEFQREDALQRWHEIYIRMTRSYGALRLVAKGYWPQLHRELLYQDKTRFKKKKKEKVLKQLAGLLSGDESKTADATFIRRYASVLAIPILIVAIVGATLFGPDTSEKGKIRASARDLQKTPEGAVQFFLQSAYDFNADDTFSQAWKLEIAVSSQDWEWFNNNYSDLAPDNFNLNSAIDPSSTGNWQKIVAMRKILSYNPNHPQDEVIDMQVNGSRATATIRKHVIAGPKGEEAPQYELELVKEGSEWKVTNIGKYVGGGDDYLGQLL